MSSSASSPSPQPPLVVKNAKALHEAHALLAASDGADWRIVRRILEAILGEGAVDYKVRHVMGRIDRPLPNTDVFIGTYFNEGHFTVVLINQRFSSFTPVLGIRFFTTEHHTERKAINGTRHWIGQRFKDCLQEPCYAFVTSKGATLQSIIYKFHLWMPFFIHYMSTLSEQKWNKSNWSQCTFRIGRLSYDNWYKEHLRASGYALTSSAASSPQRQPAEEKALSSTDH